MKVLLLQDVYKLGRAGDVKRVADGYGRNYLIPHGLAVLATPGALKQIQYIREKANVQRDQLNKEMDTVARRLDGVTVTFGTRASETGKLFGSVTPQMIAEALTKKVGVEVSRRQVDAQPLRMLGSYQVGVRLTVDLIPTIRVIVHREGEAPEMAVEEELGEELVEDAEATEAAAQAAAESE
jgi:large subunit ribosomal protein L9